METFKVLEATIEHLLEADQAQRNELERAIGTLHTLIKAKESECTYRLHLIDMLEKSRVFFDNKLSEVEKQYIEAEEKLLAPPKPPSPPPNKVVKPTKKSPKKKAKLINNNSSIPPQPMQPQPLAQIPPPLIQPAPYQVQPVTFFDPSIAVAPQPEHSMMLSTLETGHFHQPAQLLLLPPQANQQAPPSSQMFQPQQLIQQPPQIIQPPPPQLLPQTTLLPPQPPPPATQAQVIQETQQQQILQPKDENSAILESLYGGKQCSNCSLRFSDSGKYDIHLDWHFRQNLKSEIRLARRKWYYPHDLWVKFREINDDDLQKNNNDNNNHQTDTVMSEEQEVPTAPASKIDENNICPVCHESFEKFYAEDDEEWRLRNAKQYEDERIYHPLCLKDMLSSKTI